MFLIIKMYRLIPRTSKCILANTIFTHTIAKASVNVYISKNSIYIKPSKLCTTKKYHFYDNDKSQKTRKFPLLAVSLPTLIFHFFFDNENEEEVPELIMTIKRSVLLIQKGEFEKAEQMLHVALRQAHTLQHYDAITYIYDVMANLAFDTKDYQKAETLFIEVLQRLILSGALEDDMRVIHISLKMAKLFEHLGRIQKAEQGYKFCIENLKLQIERDPENKDAILLQGMTFDWYAHMLLSQSRNSEAFDYLLRAYNICEKMMGEEQEQVVILLNDLGTICYMQGKYDEAVKYLSAAARIGKRLPDMIDLGSIHVNLGNVFLKKGLYDEAKKSCQEGKKIAKKRDDNDSLLEANECLKEVKKLLSS